jgi:hypothetical protein
MWVNAVVVRGYGGYMVEMWEECCIFRMVSKILLGKIVWLSLRWLFDAASLWM